MKRTLAPFESSTVLVGRGSGADLAVGAELCSNLAPLPTCCVTLNKPFTSLGFSLLMTQKQRQQERAGPEKP